MQAATTSEGEAGSGQQRTAVVSILAAVLLVALKLGTGVATGSLSLVSAGIESSGDVVAAMLTLVAIRAARRPADDDHPYGHRRAENLAALGEAALLTGGGVYIVVEAVRRLVMGDEHPDAGWFVFVVIAIAIGIDLSRVTVSLRSARRYGSAALRSNAFHFAADLAGSVAVLGGLGLVAAGVGAGDAIAALVVAAIIFLAAGRLIRDNALVLMDTSPEEARAQALAAVSGAAPHVEVQRLRVRESGGRYFADVVVGVPAGQPVAESHHTADAIEQALESALPGSDVVVHIEPGGRDLSLREQILAVALSSPEIREVHDVNVFERDAGAIVSLHLKFDPGVPLAEAHRIADGVEDELSVLPGVRAARTHLEPLEPTTRHAEDDAGSPELEQHVLALVERMTGRPARDVRALRTRSGLVVLLTVGVDRDLTLRAAHAVASDLERVIRRDHAGIADVVVHTEPAAS